MFNIIYTKNKNTPITKLLSEAFGGEWKNVPFRREWYSETHGGVWRTCSVDEFENSHFNGYYHYNNGSTFIGFDIRCGLIAIIKAKGKINV